MESTSNYTNPGESNLFNERTQVIYGSFWERFGAALIDGIILGIVGFIIGLIFGGPSSEDLVAMSQQEGFSNAAVANSFMASYFSTANLISYVIGWLYYAIQESSAAQATIGKRALGLKVTSVNGGRISFLNALGRHFAKLLSTLILFIGYLMMLWDDKKQTLHDKLAGTLVVKSK